MERRQRTKRRTIFVAIATAVACISIPAMAAAQQGGLVDGVVKGVDGIAGTATGAVTGGGAAATGPASGNAQPDSRAGVPPTYVPPLHGTDPHGQGTVAVVDVLPSDTVPLGNDPATGEEEVILADSAGSQSNGAYNGRVTLLGINIAGVINTFTIPVLNDFLTIETAPGETKTGPFAPLQAALDALCGGIPGNGPGCITFGTMNSATTTTGSQNLFQLIGINLNLFGGNVTGGLVGSRGDISEGAGCQTATGSSNVANANAAFAPLPALVVDVLSASSSSQACQGGADTQTNSSNVLSINGMGLPIPVAGCADGTPNSSFTALAPLLSTVCNADDSNGGQTTAPYGVREALSIFALIAGNTPLLKVAASGPESHAVAPPAPPPPPTPANPTNPITPTTPGSGTGAGSGGGNNPGSGPDGSDAENARGSVASEAQSGGELAFTGINLVLLALIGGALLLAGLTLTGLAGRNRRSET